jgi:hypothetical protein
MPLPQHGLGPLQQEGQQEEEEARRNDASSTIILGQDLQIDAADVAAVQDTEDYEKVLNTMRDYRNRIQALNKKQTKRRRIKIRQPTTRFQTKN